MPLRGRGRPAAVGLAHLFVGRFGKSRTATEVWPASHPPLHAGGISKADLRRFLKWGAVHLGYPALAEVEAARERSSASLRLPHVSVVPAAYPFACAACRGGMCLHVPAPAGGCRHVAASFRWQAGVARVVMTFCAVLLATGSPHR